MDESGQPASTGARVGGHGMADRNGGARSDEPTWAGGGVPESSLDALAASWRQGTAGSSAVRAAAGAARVDATPPEGLLIEPGAPGGTARGRAEVRPPYADLIAPLPPTSAPPAPQPPPMPPQPLAPPPLAPPNGGSGYPPVNGSSSTVAERPGNGFSTGSYQVLPPGYEPMPADRPRSAPPYQAPGLYHQQQQRHQEPRYDPPRYEEPRYEEPRYEEPRYEEPRYEEPRYEQAATHHAPPAYEPSAYEPPAYDPSAYHQPAHLVPPQQPEPARQETPRQEIPRQDVPRQEAPRREPPWHEALRPEPQYGPEPPFQPVPAPEPVSALPQRVPGEPDVPDVPDEEVDDAPLAEGAPAETPELARIAAGLRYEKDDKLGAGPERPDGFDMQAVLAAVQGVEGVRDARLRKNPGGVHTLRLELADDADPGRVSREVARLLKERMGLAAEPNDRPAKRPAPDAGGWPGGQPRAGSGSATAAGPPAGAPIAPGLLPHAREPRRRHAVPTVRRAEPARAGDLGRTGDGSRDALPAAAPPQPLPGGNGAPRVVLDHVEVKTQGLDAVVEVRLSADGTPAFGVASGPAVDGYVLRLAAVAAASAIDEMLVDRDGGARGRCFIEHAAVVPFGSCEVAVVVLLMVCGGWVEQAAGSALVAGDPRQAMVRATLAAVNRRLEGLLP